MPAVSVVVPAFNAARFLAATVESVLQQTCADWELLLVDDGSQDETWAEIERLARHDPRIRGIQQDNAGPSAARNRGIAQSRSDWIALLDADDLWLPEKLQRQLDTAGSGCDLVCTNADTVDASGARPGPDWRLPDAPLQLAGRSGLRRLVLRNLVVLSSVLVRRAALTRVGCFDARFRHCEDYHLWLRLLESGARFDYLPEPLTRHRCHDANLSNDQLTMKRARAKVLADVRFRRWDVRLLRRAKWCELRVAEQRRRWSFFRRTRSGALTTGANVTS